MEEFFSFLVFIIFCVISIIAKITSHKKKQNAYVGNRSVKRKRNTSAANQTRRNGVAQPTQPQKKRQNRPPIGANKVKPPQPVLPMTQTEIPEKKVALIPPEKTVEAPEKESLVFPQTVPESLKTEYGILSNEDKRRAIIFHEIISRPKCFDY